MSIVKFILLSIVAVLIQQILLFFTRNKRAEFELASLEADLDSLIVDPTTSELDLDLWEARRFSQIESLEKQGLANELIYKMRHFHVA